MNLGELISKLSSCGSEACVKYDFAGCAPTSINSWRGIYAEPALGWRATGYSAASPSNPEHFGTMTVEKLLVELRGSIGKVFTGWKGGHYTYTESSPLHVDNPGDYTSTEIVGVDDQEHTVYLITKREA